MRNLNEIEPRGKVVFCRVDFNMPIASGEVVNEARLVRALPTINNLLAQGARLILASHLGRPKGRVVEDLRMTPVAHQLQSQLDCPVKLATCVTGSDVQHQLAGLGPGEVLLLENLRFDPGEKSGDLPFAERLAENVDLYVNEAFACCHRSDASIVQLPRLRPGYAGLLLEREINSFRELLDNPRQPFYLVAGGAKVSDKIPLLENLLDLAQGIVIGGAMAYTFLAAEGKRVGASRVEVDLVETAAGYLENAASRGIDVILPLDHTVAQEASPEAPHKLADEIEDGWMGLDIGPQTVAKIDAALSAAGTVFWNGPMGLFEMAPFRTGTRAVCESLARCSATSVIGGGDTVRAVEESGLASSISHITTGGGASLALLSGDELPGLVALRESSA